ncbi:helicase-related protein [Agrococcus sp. DT81.2]|uniref:helicase-related protein n=1 Tax=Agrococcus sp. DT81.2 TaxID=3393414 RepID=UPI003CE51CD7
MSRIVDNGAVTLSAALNEVLPHAVAFDACVGYFNLRGWRLLRNAIGAMQPSEASRPPVRLLVGMAMSADDALRQMLEGGVQTVDRPTAVRRAEQAVLGFAQQLVWGAPTKADETGLRQLRKDLEDGLVRVKFAAREPLHAKLYVAHLPSGPTGFTQAVVGSSNFTSAGMSKQGELSLEETDQQLTTELAGWFEDRWGDTFAIDVTDDLVDVLASSWIRDEQPSPYHVYLRLAYELSRDARAGLTLDIPNEVRRVLLPHQESAVRVATRLLERKGIAIIGDVVGLGKTLTGTAIAATVGESVLVIAPKNLTRMWQEHLERFHIPGRVISLSTVRRDLPDLRRFRLVLIDESHNLRNRQRKAWNAIRTYIDDNDCKVVLLTATMFNARHRDIGGQLGLKLQPDEPLGVRPERLISEVGAVEVARKTGGRLDTLSAFDRSEHNEDWQRLLSEFLVRRTRKFLETTYGTTNPESGETTLAFPDGAEFRFPKRIPEPLRYSGGPSDPNDRLATVETFQAVAGLTYARYQLGLYLSEDVIAANEEEAELIDDLRTAISAAAGFIRTTALKRLSSSAHAFLLTIKRMIARNAVLTYAVSQGRPVPLGNLSDQYFALEEHDGDLDEPDGVNDHASRLWGVGWTSEQWLDYAEGAYEQVEQKRPKAIRWARSLLFDSERLLEDLQRDSTVLQELLDTFGVWRPEDDSKLAALGKLVDGLPTGEKILVFSEYKDTVDYLAEHLPRWTNRSLATASGQSSDALRVARRFAPRANEHLGGLPEGETEVDVLLTTDVLSEGQNLQDAAIVVNWDLPWTIIKVIQRAGRVDRVGQRSKSIRVMSFLPQAGVEGVIQLRARLLERLKNSEQILGGGERFFDDDDFTSDLAGLFDGTARLSEDEGEVDSSSYALGIWEGATDRDRRIALDLQKVVYSTKATDHEAGVVTHGLTDAGTDLLVRSTGDEVVFLTPMEALALCTSHPTESPAKVLPDHLEHVDRAAGAMTEQVRQNTVLLNHGLRKRLYDFLAKQSGRIDLTVLMHAQIAQLIEAITSNPLRESAKSEVNAILRSVRVLGYDGGQMERLLALHGDHLLVDVRDLGADRVQLVTSMGLHPTTSSAGEV